MIKGPVPVGGTLKLGDGVLMLDTLKSILFVVVTVMLALVIQAHAGKLAPDQLEAADTAPLEQLQVYN